ncbi:pyridine nucleotide-disulfide oxidoreductase [Desulfosporosinus sp. Tol-M]|nr:pyridine nucleotide-disulfide oxidoreductase [Desulfosporosinus sp. Tol-M]
MNYVIIGNSTAAIGCIEGIRQIDKTGLITVISREKYHTYSRPLISYLLSGKTDEERMKYRPNNFYQEMNCKLLTEKTVEKILSDEKKVLLEDGSVLSYDKLLVATGSNPFVPPIQGLESVENRFTFMSLDDALAIQKAITQSTRVLILGAGLIGLKCAEGIAEKAGHITLVDLADRILPSILDEESSAIVQAHLEKQQLEFILADSVQAFDANSAVLTGGKKYKFDVLIVAVGVKPNTKLIAEAGGEVQKGIVTDEYCRCTLLPDIYAAGDCTESYDISADEARVLALLPNAYMQGECAGINMAGGEKLYTKAIPMNATSFFGLHIITAGSYMGSEYVSKGENSSYKKLVTREGLLKGYILIGDVARAGIYTALIKEKKPLTSIDFELIKDKPQLMAFSRVEREKMLGGR